jgi:hypothetical protein
MSHSEAMRFWESFHILGGVWPKGSDGKNIGPLSQAATFEQILASWEFRGRAGNATLEDVIAYTVARNQRLQQTMHMMPKKHQPKAPSRRKKNRRSAAAPYPIMSKSMREKVKKSRNAKEKRQGLKGQYTNLWNTVRTNAKPASKMDKSSILDSAIRALAELRQAHAALIQEKKNLTQKVQQVSKVVVDRYHQLQSQNKQPQVQPQPQPQPQRQPAQFPALLPIGNPVGMQVCCPEAPDSPKTTLQSVFNAQNTKAESPTFDGILAPLPKMDDETTSFIKPSRNLMDKNSLMTFSADTRNWEQKNGSEWPFKPLFDNVLQTLPRLDTSREEIIRPSATLGQSTEPVVTFTADPFKDGYENVLSSLTQHELYKQQSMPNFKPLFNTVLSSLPRCPEDLKTGGTISPPNAPLDDISPFKLGFDNVLMSLPKHPTELLSKYTSPPQPTIPSPPTDFKPLFNTVLSSLPKHDPIPPMDFFKPMFNNVLSSLPKHTSSQ